MPLNFFHLQQRETKIYAYKIHKQSFPLFIFIKCHTYALTWHTHTLSATHVCMKVCDCLGEFSFFILFVIIKNRSFNVCCWPLFVLLDFFFVSPLWLVNMQWKWWRWRYTLESTKLAYVLVGCFRFGHFFFQDFPKDSAYFLTKSAFGSLQQTQATTPLLSSLCSIFVCGNMK